MFVVDPSLPSARRFESLKNRLSMNLIVNIVEYLLVIHYLIYMPPINELLQLLCRPRCVCSQPPWRHASHLRTPHYGRTHYHRSRLRMEWLRHSNCSHSCACDLFCLLFSHNCISYILNCYAIFSNFTLNSYDGNINKLLSPSYKKDLDSASF